MEMNDTFDFAGMQTWLADILKEKGITRHSQVLGKSEEELLDSSVLSLGTIINLSWYFEDRGLYFRGGKNSLSRLHMHKPGLKLLRSHGIYDLNDLSYCSWHELAYKIGFGRERADFIRNRMAYLGMSLRD